jgi:aminoglycoside phosphotransferase (APT) family kinase protein
MLCETKYRVTTEEIRAVLEEVLSEHFEAPQKILRLNRRRSAYSSSYAIENLDVELSGQERRRLVLKDTSPSAVLAFEHHVRPSIVFRPEREIEVYQKLLGPELGTPIYYGSRTDGSPRYWLFLERVAGRPLWQFGRLEPWQEAARWLARLHGQFGIENHPASIPGSEHLVRYDEAFLRSWVARAEHFLSRKLGGTETEIRHRFGRMMEHYDEVIEKLRALPASFIHGEFYASNVLVRQRSHRAPTAPDKVARRGGIGNNDGTRGDIRNLQAGMSTVLSGTTFPYRGAICPVDWEMAGIGPGLMDLAALTAGKWKAEAKEQMVKAYHEAQGGQDDWTESRRDLIEAVDYCQLQLCIQWLGWADAWSPPEHHAQDWLREAVRLGDQLHLGCRSGKVRSLTKV